MANNLEDWWKEGKAAKCLCCITGGFVSKTDGTDRLQYEVHSLDHCEVIHIQTYTVNGSLVKHIAKLSGVF